MVPTAYQAPDMNAIAERFVGTVKRECLNRLILFGAGHLQRALQQFVEHYHAERPHQGIGNRLIQPGESNPESAGDNVVAKKRLGGLLRSYRRVA